MLKPLAVSLRVTGVALAAAGLFLALPAQAVVVLDTFGMDDTAPGQRFGLTPTSMGQSLAVAFTLESASTITDILTSISGDGSYDLGIVAGTGLPSGNFVFSTVLSNPRANSSANGLGWTLEAGAYWLVSRAGPDSFGGEWTGGGQAASSPWAFTSSGNWFPAGNSDTPAARITVTAIPEPGTWALMLGGLAVCAAAVRRQRG